MGDLVLKGSTSGQITVTPTAVAGTNTLTLPAKTGNIITSADSGTVTSGMLSTGAPSWDSSGNLSFNSGYGSNSVSYGCRAWVRYNAVTPAIVGSGNVTSVTVNATGDYTINFTNSLVDANYAISGVAGLNTTSLKVVVQPYNTAAPTTGSVRIQTPQADGTLGASAPPILCVSVFR